MLKLVIGWRWSWLADSCIFVDMLHLHSRPLPLSCLCTGLNPSPPYRLKCHFLDLNWPSHPLCQGHFLDLNWYFPYPHIPQHNFLHLKLYFSTITTTLYPRNCGLAPHPSLYPSDIPAASFGVVVLILRKWQSWDFSICILSFWVYLVNTAYFKIIGQFQSFWQN